MKRSKQIQLVLITAALASCNRVIIPRQAITCNYIDSTLTAAPVIEVNPCENTSNPCCQESYSRLWNYSFNPYGGYYTSPLKQSYYYSHRKYRKGSFWRSDHFIVRGGLGKSSVSASS